MTEASADLLDLAHRNELRLVGKVTAPPVERPLPSGGGLAIWRVAVRRPTGVAGTRQLSDALTCVAFAEEVRKEVASWQSGDIVEVRGAVRRRFWQSPAGPSSRYEVEVGYATRLRPQ